MKTILKVFIGFFFVVLLSFSVIATTTSKEDLKGVYNPITQDYIYMSVIPKQTQNCENKSIFVCEEVLS